MSNLIKIITLSISLLIVGCDDSKRTWANAANTHKCNAEQLKTVFTLTKQCLDGTDYMSAYCMGVSIISVCEENPSQARKR